MHVRVKPKLHTHTESGPRFLPLLHTSYISDYLLVPLSEMSSQGIMSGKKANRGQTSGLGRRTRARN